ncbi:3'-5' exonuclease [Nonomuraea sp. FMUSA5-5]|uniref:3'-5' exonuclease n=1 Tax=Nonomuraea composti TaxID=2720023 RepID=A0ABX1BS67_9ACTN|nr:3'-5' exonuclease [Nonomuraea sp. FMUSA5-5]NJP98641.1 3'-5' exonuclease [Nonomuraea sp. FMUSA5-5]
MLDSAPSLDGDEDFARQKITYLVIDFEGLTPKGRSPVPVEVAVCAVRLTAAGLVERWRYDALMAAPADVPVTGRFIAQTGISAAMLAGAVPPGRIMADLDARLTDPPYRLVAHHAPTEAGLIAGQREHCPILAAVPLLDTVRLARVVYPELPSHRLDELVRHLRLVPPGRRHRALPDVLITVQVFERLVLEGARAGIWKELRDLDRLGGLAAKRPVAPEAAQASLF